ncbi:MAG: 50S ribosomal protein L5 [Thioalkalivibrio sp.]|nr:50S ribosomal protein L5 [Thioalkalivibrio sp.]
MKPRLLDHYRTHVRPKLLKELEFVNVHQVPTLQKIVVNVGVGEAAKDQKLLESVVEELGIITGQKPLVNRARKAISNFGLREGMPIGVSVTLRRERMWFFLDRLVSTAIPRIRDFRGLNTRSFDGRGNYTLGVKEQIIFPEIKFDEVRKIHGMDITFVTSTDKDDEGLALLRELGFPFRGEIPVQITAAAS